MAVDLSGSFVWESTVDVFALVRLIHSFFLLHNGVKKGKKPIPVKDEVLSFKAISCKNSAMMQRFSGLCSRTATHRGRALCSSPRNPTNREAPLLV